MENWNTENVIKMESMFAGLSQFNEPLYKWDTSKVNNMIGMFFCLVYIYS
ncbi:BspA family leucine-rich repeat surface protein [Brachyspira catarrhinii]|nr:BspA family leucine-rich repeat surface protein [Brachyspira catarrhinii]